MGRAKRVRERLALMFANLRRAQAFVAVGLLSAGFFAISLTIRLPALQAWDRSVSIHVQRIGSEALDQVAIAITFFGSAPALVGTAAAAAGALWLMKKPWAAFGSMLSLVGLGLNPLFKIAFGRERPSGGGIEVILPAAGLSYPSGHAMASTAVYGWIAALGWVLLPGRARLWALLMMGTLVVGIGLSRVYLGAHYISDVVGGTTAGLLLVTLLALWYRKVASHERPTVAAVAEDAGQPG